MPLPVYLQYKRKEIETIAEKLENIATGCELCPRNCKINRDKEVYGICGIGNYAIVSSFGLHFGEEPVLVGKGGSGTVFFGGCNLKCIFCQNYEISWQKEGELVSTEQLGEIFLSLSKDGAHNINLVSPTHVIHFIVRALVYARDKGLSLPLVYNTGGYDSIEVIKLLEKIIDIYMPDMKYSDNSLGLKLSGVKDYVEINREVVKEMFKQKGNLKTLNGIAYKGLIIRHLVLPGHKNNSIGVLNFIAEEIVKDVYLNIMDQYWPSFKAKNDSVLGRRVDFSEVEEIRNHWLKIGGSSRGWNEKLW